MGKRKVVAEAEARVKEETEEGPRVEAKVRAKAKDLAAGDREVGPVVLGGPILLTAIARRSLAGIG
jgi:hypothetical protein